MRKYETKPSNKPKVQHSDLTQESLCSVQIYVTKALININRIIVILIGELKYYRFLMEVIFSVTAGLCNKTKKISKLFILNCLPMFVISCDVVLNCVLWKVHSSSIHILVGIFRHCDNLITKLRELPSYRDDGILILFFGSISLQAGINIKKNWMACSRVKPTDGDHTRFAWDWHS